MKSPLQWDLRRQWPLAILVVLVLVFSAMLMLSRKAPIISGIEPAMAAPGELVTLTGDYFGRTAREGQLTLGGVTPPPSLVREWGDQRVVFEVPEDAPSGLVTISNSQGVSASVLFTNTLTIPTVLRTRLAPAPLEITSITPSVPVPGQLVSLSGRGLGHAEAGSWLELAASSAPQEPQILRLAPVLTTSWSDQQITFVLPAGWGLSAVIAVHSPRGTSSRFALQSSGPVALSAPHEEVLEWHYSINVAKGQGVLHLLGPSPDLRAGLNWSDLGGDPLRWVNPPAGTLQGKRLIKVARVGKVWNGFSAGQVVPDDVSSPSEPVAAFPSAWKPIQAALKVSTAKWNLDTADPLLRVRRILSSVQTTYHRGPAEPVAQLTLSGVLPAAALDPLTAAAITSIVAQQNGLSVRLIRGWYFGDTDVRAHVWLQVWIPGAAWVDFDPWLLLDQADADLDRSFGNLDDRHLPWTLAGAGEIRSEGGSRAVRSDSGLGGTTLLAELTGELETGVVSWQIKARP